MSAQAQRFQTVLDPGAPGEVARIVVPLDVADWERLAFTHRKEHVLAIEGARKPETRARRIEKAVASLASRGK